MNSLLSFALKSARYNKKNNALLILAASVCVAVLSGALIVGDSMNISLREIEKKRRGEITHILQTPYPQISEAVCNRLNNEEIIATPIIKANSTIQISSFPKKSVSCNLYGVSQNSMLMGLKEYPKEGEVFLGIKTATALSIKKGERVVFRIKKLNSHDFSAGEDAEIISITGVVSKILDENQGGAFSLTGSHKIPQIAYISLSTLQKAMDTEAINMLAVKTKQESAVLNNILKKHLSMRDFGYTIKTNNGFSISKDSIIINKSIAKEAKRLDARIYFMYLANAISGKETSPYPFVCGIYPSDNLLPNENSVAISSWLKEDTQTKEGNHVVIKWSIGENFSEEKEETFSVSKVIPLSSPLIDKTLAPAVKGLTDVESCSKWDISLDINLDLIRDKDEAYWNKYKASPKAFINLEKAAKMYGKGGATLIRLNDEKKLNALTKIIFSNEMSTGKYNFFKTPPIASAKSDFSSLILSLSFFIIASSLILTAMLFSLSLKQREKETSLLKAFGIKKKYIFLIRVLEASFTSFLALIPGSVLAVLYSSAIFLALQTVWQGASQMETTGANLKITPSALLIGGASSFAVSLLCITITAYLSIYKAPVKQIKKRKPRISLVVAISSFLSFITLFIVTPDVEASYKSSLFFTAGMLLLACLISVAYISISLIGRINFKATSLFKLSIKSLGRNVLRSVMLISLFASSVFLVISISAMKQNISKTTNASPTGGFSLYAESTFDITDNYNDEKVRFKRGISENDKFKNSRFIPLLKREGDDLSCLNLIEATSPSLLAVPYEFAEEGRFEFENLPAKDAWQKLFEENTNAVNAIADEAVLTWTLKKKIGDTIKIKAENGEEISLVFIDALTRSLFQESIIISEENMKKYFPSVGRKVMLINNSASSKASAKELSTLLSDGIEVIPAKEKVALFLEVENTYISIFQSLGMIGLLLASAGIAILTAAMLSERKKEYALIKALGIGFKHSAFVITCEIMLMLGISLIIGAVSAFTALIPVENIKNTPIKSSLLILLLMFFISFASSLFIVINTKPDLTPPDEENSI